MTRLEAVKVLAGLLRETVEQEAAIAVRDREILAIQEKYAKKISTAGERIAAAEAQLEEFARAELTGDVHHMDLQHGRIGLRAPASPALVPLSEKWTWAKIAARVKRLYSARFFHPPKPPALDKTKIKSVLGPEQLAAVGLKLDDTQHFYIDLNRLQPYEEAA